MKKIVSPQGLYFIGTTGIPAKVVYLGTNDSKENYHTITDEEAEAILHPHEENNEEKE